MIRSALAGCLLLLSVLASLAAGQPLVRVTVLGDQPALVGKQVEVRVQVLAPNYFMSSVELPAIDMAEAIVTLPDQKAANSTETIDGESYASIAKTYLITPLTAGALTLPAARLSFSYAAVPGTATEASIEIPATKVEAIEPPGAAGGNTLPVAVLRVTQSFAPKTAVAKGLTVGDTLTRTVTVTADGARAMLIPPPSFPELDGIRAYRAAPVLTDANGMGSRTDVVTYLPQRAGEFALPAVTVPWVDPTTGKAAVSTADGIELHVTAAQETSATIPPAPAGVPVADGTRLPRWPWAMAAGLIVSVGIVLLAVRRWLPAVRAGWQAFRREQGASEAAAFRAIRTAVGDRDQAGAYRALSVWVSRQGHASIGEWTRQAGSRPVEEAVASLERDLFAMPTRPKPWDDAPEFLRLISASRRAATAKSSRSARPALPALNPWSEQASPERHW